MSTSPLQLKQFAEFVKDHDALPVFREKVYEKFFTLFLNASNSDEREEISHTVDCYNAFMSVLNEAIKEITPVENVNDTAEDTMHE